MSFGEVNYMNIIAPAGAVWRIVVVAEDFKFFPFAASDVHDNRHDIVWNTVRVFADKVRWVIADWVKIAQERSGKIWIGCADIFKNLLDHIFGFAIWARYLAAGLHRFDIFW